MTSVLNQVEDIYNGYGQLIKQYQATSGSVNISTSPVVLYGYSQPSGANYSRPTNLTYPSGRVVDYGYNAGIDTTISRLSGVSDSNGTNIESYSYLGLSTIVRKIRPGSVLTLVKAYGASNGDAGDLYAGLDRFGHVVDQRWVKSDTPNGSAGDTLGVPTERFQYGYDPNGDVLYRANLVNSAFSELYHANGASEAAAYDPLNRLTTFRRGTLTSSGNNGSTLDTIASASATDSWVLDALGNSTSAGGVSRTFNAKNQIATYGGSSSMTYDHDGNMTADQAGNMYRFDAWNRMVSVGLSSNLNFPGEFYTYDALGRRPGLTITNGGITSSYYSAGWQDLEDDVTLGSTHTVNTFVWSESYIDDLVARDQSVNGGTPTRIFAQQDANHDVTSLVNSSGTVLERFAYAPYGSRTVLSASWTAGSDSYNWLVGFQGGRLDPLTGLVNFRNRDLNTGLDVWMEEDPKGYVNGTDLYEAFVSAPTVFTDPMGTDIWIEGPSGSEPTGHQSIAIGDPNGYYVSYSFGVGSPALTWTYGLTGYVYQDDTLGGEIVPGSYLTTDPAFDAAVKRILADLVRKNEPHEYRLVDANCRTFSQTFYQAIVNALKNTGAYHPGKAPVRHPQRGTGPGASSTNSGASSGDSSASSSSSSPGILTTTGAGASLSGDLKDGAATSAVGTTSGAVASKPCPCAGGPPKPGKIGK